MQTNLSRIQGTVTLSEESTGIEHEPNLRDKSRWIAWLRTGKTLTHAEAEREWCWRQLEHLTIGTMERGVTVEAVEGVAVFEGLRINDFQPRA